MTIMTMSKETHLSVLLMAAQQLEPILFKEIELRCCELAIQKIPSPQVLLKDEEEDSLYQLSYDSAYDDDYYDQDEEDEDECASRPTKKRKTEKSKKSDKSGGSRVEWSIEAEPQPCPFGCGRTYTSTIGMKSHLKRFHLHEQESNHEWSLPDLRFQCPYCEYHSNRRSNLERHLNRYHIDDYTEGVVPKNKTNHGIATLKKDDLVANSTSEEDTEPEQRGKKRKRKTLEADEIKLVKIEPEPMI